MYKPIDLLKYEDYVQTHRPLKNMRSMYKTDRPLKI